MAEPVKLEELITCPKCGESNLTGSRHCSSCGASLTSAKTAPPKPEKKQAKLADKLKRKA
jgi:hypothetical protein